MSLWSHRLWKSTFWQEICHPLKLHKIQIAKKKIKNISPLRIRAYHVSRVRQTVLLVDGQVVFIGVRRPTLWLIRLKMSEIILKGRKTQIKKKMKKKKKKMIKKIVKNYPGRNRTWVTRMVGQYLKRYCWIWRSNYHPYKTTTTTTSAKY